MQHLSKSHSCFDRIDFQVLKKEGQISTVVCWFNTQAGGLTFSSQQQKDSRGIQTEAEIQYTKPFFCSTVIYQPAPLYSCFFLSLYLSLSLSLTHTQIVWMLFYPPLSYCLSHLLSLPLSASLCLSLSLCLFLLSNTHILSLCFRREITRRREQPGCLACEDDRHMWIVTQQSYIICPFLLSLFPSITHTPADALTCSTTANGNTSPGRLCWPHQHRADQKLQPVLRGQGYKTVSRLSLFKNNWPLWPSSSRAFSYHDMRGGGAQVGWVRGRRWSSKEELNCRLDNALKSLFANIQMIK